MMSTSFLESSMSLKNIFCTAFENSTLMPYWIRISVVLLAILIPIFFFSSVEEKADDSIEITATFSFQDYMLIDPFINGFAEMNDRHRDLRLDVDNMSYEVL